MAGRDPEEIERDIERARNQLAATVDELADRANPHKVVEQTKAKALELATKPVVLVPVAGIGLLIVFRLLRRIFRR